MRPDSLPATRFVRYLRPLAVAGLLVLGSGCIYKMSVQQGNYLNPTQMSQLETGMTRSQVLFLLGTPMVPNGFDGDRWDYYYYIKAGRKWEANTSRLMVLFQDDKVYQIVRDGRIEPPKAPSKAELLPTEPLPPPPNPTEAGKQPTQTTPVTEPTP